MVAVCDNNHLKVLPSEVLTQQKGVKTLQHASIPAFKRILLSFSNKLFWHTPVFVRLTEIIGWPVPD